MAQPSICLQCGWWNVHRIHQNESPRSAGIVESHSGAIGCLTELNLNDVTIPLNQVRQYLLAKEESMYNVSPKLFEEVVCSIFKDMGWNARVTAYSGDNGIDVILDNSSGDTIGIQVKRYQKKHKIEAEQIRSLAGALLVGGHTKGIFVTTSSFRSGAKETAQKSTSIGYPIELIDSKRFLNALGIAQVNSFKLNNEQITSYVLSSGAFMGVGSHKDFNLGEDLREREIVASVWTKEELIDLNNN
jgi:restriction system protein